jgi:hypothetical protein
MDYAVVSTDGFVLHTTDMGVACREFVMRALESCVEDSAAFDMVRVNRTEYIVSKQPDSELRLYGVSWAQWRELAQTAGRGLN